MQPFYDLQQEMHRTAWITAKCNAYAASELLTNILCES